jgi:LysM repeat protein
MTDNATTALPRHSSVIEWTFLVAVIALPVSLHLGFFGVVVAEGNNLPVTETIVPANISALDTPVLSAVKNPNPQGFRGGAEVMVNDGALVSSGPVGEDIIAASKNPTGEISVYTVRAGDTLSHIAQMYGVTSNTILWANDLPRATAIKEGQSLVILPVAGVRHVVKKGDTLSSIAKKYSGKEEDILTYNQIDDNSGLVVGEVLVIPGGTIKVAPIPVGSKSGTKLAGGSWLAHPVPGSIKTQGIHGFNAVDLASAYGTSVRAAGSGEVIVSKSSGWNGGYGQYIVIRHSNGAQTLYAHLSRNDVGVGAYVDQGEVIAAMGNSGRSTGSHLHFEVRGASNPF